MHVSKQDIVNGGASGEVARGIPYDKGTINVTY